MKKLFLIDAYAMIYRAFYSLINNPMVNSKGESTSAVYGFMNFLLDILKNEQFSHIAVVFDPPYPTFRNKIYPEYKAQRPLTPEGIKTGVPRIKDILDAIGVKRVEVPEYEADDVIGTLAKKARREGFEVYMVTPDKDYNQLLEDGIYIYKPQKGKNADIVSAESFCKETGLDNPAQFIDILALWGDAADNVKGVPGIGEKTAYKLITQFKSGENIYKNISLLKGKQKESFLQHKDDYLLAHQLVTIVTDAPTEFVEDDFVKKPVDEDKLRKILDELEMKGLSSRILPKPKPIEAVQGSLFFDPNTVTPEPPKPEAVRHENINTVPHTYHVVDNDDDLVDLRHKLLELSEFCFDTETTGLETRNLKIVGMSFCFKAHEAYYVPFNVDDEDETRRRLEFFRPALMAESIAKVGQNLKFDILVLRNYGIEVRGRLFDTMVADYMVNPDRKHNMDYLSEGYLNYTPVHIEELIGEKKSKQTTMDKVDIQQIKEYAAEDADVTFQLKEKLYAELQKYDLLKAADEIEMPLIYVLADMEFNGVCINTSFLKEYTDELNAKVAAKEQEIYKYAGKEFNVSSTRQLGEILFDEMKVADKPKTTKTGQYSTSEDELAKIKDKHPIIQAILDYRGIKKLVNTYTEALPELINPKTGRIHTNFNQCVTSTGRLSSSNPNIQNIPIRTEEGQKVRAAFIPSTPENFIFAADYSQVELRVMAHLSGDEAMILAFNNDEDFHRATAARLYDIPPEQVTKQQRSFAKSVNFGINYGISAFGLSQDTGLSRNEAKDLIDEYFNTFSGVKKFMETTVADCRAKGYVSTMFGHRRYLPDINSRNVNVRAAAERLAVNTIVQGTAAEIIKIAMNNIRREFISAGLRSQLLIQVHDELVFDVLPDEKSAVEEIVVRQMESAAQLKVKLKVEGKFAKNWLEAH
ncbi:MAG: DNA polymerase I [Bacteroidales bacterium]|nr:DNA polymerase I [Bacteroidales bacterium]